MFDPFKPFWNKKWALAVLVFGTLLVGILLGALVFQDSFTQNYVSDACPADLKFVKPQQDCESFENASDKIDNLQSDLRQQVNGYLNANRADRISVFVRDLDSQRFATVNETEEFFMASLLKVPLAIAYYRLAQLTPDLLSQRVTYTGKTDLYDRQNIQPSVKLVAGTTYTVKELLRRALSYSDNTASELLSQNYVSDDYLQKILFTMGLQPRAKDQQENLVTARSYAGIFRTLYNTSFLSREYSDEILKDLSESTFADGATAKIPKGVLVSHKFGERELDDAVTGEVVIRQLHDCGIVYAGKGEQAYSFCIMTEGKDFSDLKSVVQNVSASIYEGITE